MRIADPIHSAKCPVLFPLLGVIHALPLLRLIVASLCLAIHQADMMAFSRRLSIRCQSKAFGSTGSLSETVLRFFRGDRDRAEAGRPPAAQLFTSLHLPGKRGARRGVDQPRRHRSLRDESRPARALAVN
jgi:hypothetical protein